MTIRLLLYSALLLMAGTLPAMAACTTPTVTASFGGVSSFTVNTTPGTVQRNITVNCGGGVLALLSSDSIKLQLTGATAVATTGSRGALKLNTDLIPLQLCSDVNCSNELGLSGTIYTLSRSQLLGLNIGGVGQVVFNVPLYLRTVPGAVVAEGKLHRHTDGDGELRCLYRRRSAGGLPAGVAADRHQRTVHYR